MTILDLAPCQTVLRQTPVKGRQNVHHWAFERLRFNAIEVGQKFRGLTCARSVADIGVHGAENFIQPEPWWLKVSQMHDFIDRHDARECGCFDEAQVTVVNLLSPLGHGPTLNLPCEWVWIDRGILEGYVLARYSRPKRLSENWRHSLLERHESGQCACSVPGSAGAMMQPTAPSLAYLAPTG